MSYFNLTDLAILIPKAPEIEETACALACTESKQHEILACRDPETGIFLQFKASQYPWQYEQCAGGMCYLLFMRSKTDHTPLKTPTRQNDLRPTQEHPAPAPAPAPAPIPAPAPAPRLIPALPTWGQQGQGNVPDWTLLLLGLFPASGLPPADNRKEGPWVSNPDVVRGTPVHTQIRIATRTAMDPVLPRTSRDRGPGVRQLHSRIGVSPSGNSPR